MSVRVVCFVRNEGELWVRRPPTSSARWDVPSGEFEEGTVHAARQLVSSTLGEETNVELVRSCERANSTDGRAVHTYLFNCPARPEIDDSAEFDHRWVRPTALSDVETERDLWELYRTVAPSTETISSEVEYGSAYLSVRALEVLRDRLGGPAVVEDRETVMQVADEILTTQPNMAVLRSRIIRAIATAEERTPSAVAESAHELISRVEQADEAAAANAADRLDGETVFTVSRSGTVLETLEKGSPSEVIITVSETDREGVSAAEIVGSHTDVTLVSDAATAHCFTTFDVDVVLVGADGILSDGSVVNKVGTRAAALAAADEGIPVYVVSAVDKIRTSTYSPQEQRPESALYDGDSDISVFNPVFDVTPSRLVDAIVTEEGTLTASDVTEYADRLRRLESEIDEL